MIVKELIRLLEKLDSRLEVIITDGYQCRCYCGDFIVNICTDCHGNAFADIGIGGCEE